MKFHEESESKSFYNILIIEDQSISKIKLYSHLTFLLQDRARISSIIDQETFEKRMKQFEILMKKGKFKEEDVDLIFLSSHLSSKAERNGKLNAKKNIERLHQLFPLTKIYVVTPHSKFEEVYDEVSDEYGIELLMKPIDLRMIKKCVENL